jgi:flagellar biosynthesis/type III secretory pathway chaperone
MSELTQTFSRELESLKRFLAILDEEHALLKDGQVDRLETLDKRKTAIIDELRALGHQRNTLLEQAGYALDKSGVDAWIKAHPGDLGLPRLWESFRTHATRVKQVAETNAHMIASKLQTTQRALDILLHAGNSSEPLYSADGFTASTAGKRINDTV